MRRRIFVFVIPPTRNCRFGAPIFNFCDPSHAESQSATAAAAPAAVPSRHSRGRRPKAMTRTALPGLPFAPDSRMAVGNLPQITLDEDPERGSWNARTGTRDGTRSGTRDPAERANRNALCVERAFVGVARDPPGTGNTRRYWEVLKQAVQGRGGRANFIPRLNPERANRNARTRNAERTPERANQII